MQPKNSGLKMSEIMQLSPELKSKALRGRKISFIKEVTLRNKQMKNTDVPHIMAKKFNKHLNECLKQVEDAATKQNFEIPSFENNRYIKEHSTESFMNFIAFKHNESQIKSYEEAVVNKKSEKPATTTIDVNKEFKNYLATKHFAPSDALDLEEYCRITFKTPNGLPEIVNDIALYMFLKLPLDKIIKERSPVE